jgi:hypothetical protein
MHFLFFLFFAISFNQLIGQTLTEFDITNINLGCEVQFKELPFKKPSKYETEPSVLVGDSLIVINKYYSDEKYYKNSYTHNLEFSNFRIGVLNSDYAEIQLKGLTAIKVTGFFKYSDKDILYENLSKTYKKKKKISETGESTTHRFFDKKLVITMRILHKENSIQIIIVSKDDKC